MKEKSPDLYAHIIRLAATQNGRLPNRLHITQLLNLRISRQKG